jgi:putative transcriptional regulator
VRTARVSEVVVPDVRAIREAASISQTQLAKLIGVNLRTLQYWEQHSTRPTSAIKRASLDFVEQPESSGGGD